MPELPEVESVRRSLLPYLLGRSVVQSILHRADIVEGDTSPAALLQGHLITALQRRGKLLSFHTSGRVLAIHLGMSGQLLVLAEGAAPKNATHLHAEWRLDSGERLIFRDPRRFGGISTHATEADFQSQRLQALGPDALTIDTTHLAQSLRKAKRPIKAALLDQGVLAGVGNIYADESLFLAAINPARPCTRLNDQDFTRLASAIRDVLTRAIASGGSTLRDYVNASGDQGSYTLEHSVYGRTGQTCLRCATPLKTRLIAQRTTVWCPTCQPTRPASRSTLARPATAAAPAKPPTPGAPTHRRAAKRRQ